MKRKRKSPFVSADGLFFTMLRRCRMQAATTVNAAALASGPLFYHVVLFQAAQAEATVIAKRIWLECVFVMGGFGRE